MKTDSEKTMGWEIARSLEQEKTTTLARFVPGWRQVKAALCGIFVFFLVFLLGCWLAGNPFEATQRITFCYRR